MKKFIIYWLDNTLSELYGYDIADAFTRAGYGAGALLAVDYWKEVK